MPDPGEEHAGDRPVDIDKQLAKFSHKLAELAQRQLDRHLAPRLDGEDVVQSAFQHFCGETPVAFFRSTEPRSSGNCWSTSL